MKKIKKGKLWRKKTKPKVGYLKRSLKWTNLYLL